LRLQIVVFLIGILSYVALTQGDPETAVETKDQPFAQIARDDLHAPVWSISFSSDGRDLAASTVTGDVCLKNLATGRVVRLQAGGRMSARSVAIAPDAQVLAVRGDGTSVGLWNLDNASEPSVIDTARRGGKCVAFAPDGALLAVSETVGLGKGAVIALWNWRRRRRLATLEGHRGAVNALAFSPDGSTLASGDAQGVVKFWDRATQRERASLQAHEFGRVIQALAFSPDGTLLVTAALLDRTVRLWDAASGAPQGTLPAPEKGANALAFAPHRPILAMDGGDGAAWLWDITRGRPLGALRTRGATLRAMAFSADGFRLATGGTDGALRLWDLTKVLPPSKPAAGTAIPPRRGSICAPT
jgi:WD40 repeat protein